MSILCDREIAALCTGGRPMIEPFVPEQRRDKGGSSYGLSSMGYDIRLGSTFKRMRPDGPAIDTRRPDPEDWWNYDGDCLFIPAGQARLACSVETFRMPGDVFGTCYGKSSLARVFIHVLVTPLEPGWDGVLTLEIVNHSPRGVLLHSGDGICQIRFDRGAAPDVSYADRAGRYMHQAGVCGPKP